jgi:ferric-dicitrate binding protein FerR (iron transport regulator)
MVAKSNEDQVFHMAIDWWIRLHTVDVDDSIFRRWRAWVSDDSRHLKAFEFVDQIAPEHLEAIFWNKYSAFELPVATKT